VNIKEIYEKLIGARRPVDFFGSAKTTEELRKLYQMFAKIVHPDTADDKYLAGEAFKELGQKYADGKRELEAGIYAVFDPVKLYQSHDPILEIKACGTVYKFYEHVFDGEVANVYKGLQGNDVVFLKAAKDVVDNKLIEQEVGRQYAFVMRELVGETMPDLMARYRGGLPTKHVAWMLERLFSVVGYLHFNLVVHGNLKPEHIIINKDNHNVSLCGFSMCIKEANKPTAKYQIQNEFYTAPEVELTATVSPVSDIFSIGKIAIELLGGNIENDVLPNTVEKDMKKFVLKLVDRDLRSRPRDAWQLWDELIQLRRDMFGAKRFEKLD
jgi:serine/threonine protein kinase